MGSPQGSKNKYGFWQGEALDMGHSKVMGQKSLMVTSESASPGKAAVR